MPSSIKSKTVKSKDENDEMFVLPSPSEAFSKMKKKPPPSSSSVLQPEVAMSNSYPTNYHDLQQHHNPSQINNTDSQRLGNPYQRPQSYISVTSQGYYIGEERPASPIQGPAASNHSSFSVGNYHNDSSNYSNYGDESNNYSNYGDESNNYNNNNNNNDNNNDNNKQGHVIASQQNLGTYSARPVGAQFNSPASSGYHPTGGHYPQPDHPQSANMNHHSRHQSIQISEDQQLKMFFDRNDVYHDGRIDCIAVGKSLKNFDKTHFRESVVQKLFEFYDRDQKGRLDFQQFRDLFKYVKFWRDVFDEYDNDGNEAIEFIEFMNALRAKGYKIEQNLIEKVFQKFCYETESRRFMKLDSFIEAVLFVLLLTKDFVSFTVNPGDETAPISFDALFSLVLKYMQ
ncbi:hypothetical protein DASC09_036810 [Saccharomycopsis crataegensis]|uniref:EF-hand domain-containing protein n=1 Tax=Saccharomycopsis crataegensis TaxID=43959 RepID=A0AAV5QNR5_9ASCO|nr:hypothetical protein DASC09_036810 [Saccharomycopsis crataegensis]